MILHVALKTKLDDRMLWLLVLGHDIMGLQVGLGEGAKKYLMDESVGRLVKLMLLLLRFYT